MSWQNEPTTLEEIEALPKETLTCSNVAKVLNANPYAIHQQAIERPELLGFPTIVAGRRVKIPKQPFLKFMRGEYGKHS